MPISVSKPIAEVDVQLEPATETKAEREARLSVYHEIKRQLIAQGIPANEIAFAHDYDGPIAQAALSRKMNAGELRIVLASTAKLGVGSNIQERLYALHHLDAPWRPADIEQREGRILRQGNRFPEVHICQYVTEGSFDAYSWQILENKTRFIAQIMKGEVTARTAEDVDQAVLTAAQIKAIASGNPLVLEKVGLEAELIRLERLYSTWFAGRHRLRTDLTILPSQIKEVEADLRAHEAAIVVRDQFQTEREKGDKQAFLIALRRNITEEELIQFRERERAGNQLRQLAAATERRASASGSIRLRLGEYGGFELHASADSSQGANGLDLFGEVKLYLKLSDSHVGYVFNLTDSDAGIIQSMDARLRKLEARRDEAAETHRRKTDKLAKIEAELARGWEHAAKYQELRTRLEALNASLPIADSTPDDASEKIELVPEAFLPVVQAGDEINFPAINLELNPLSSKSVDSSTAQTLPVIPAPAAADVIAQTTPATEAKFTASTTIQAQLLAQREQVIRRKRSRVKTSLPDITQMSFDWA